MRDKKRVTSKDVAKAAGVAQSTVSRVFSKNSHVISEATRNKIMKIADEMGYRPSLIARSLRNSTSNIIGIEINDFKNSYYMKSLGMFTEAFQERGYNVMIFNIKDLKKMDESLRKAFEYQLAGLIVTNADLSDDYLGWCREYRIPIFLYNRVDDEETGVNSVVCDNYSGGREVAKLFVANGYKNIVYIAGDEKSSTNKGREKGFSDYLKIHKMNYKKIQGAFNYKSGFDSAKKIIDSEKTEAVFCASDSIALGVIDYIKNNTTLNIPRDISVIGFDNIDEGENINYQLTTYAQPIKELVEKTVNNMIDKIENNNRDIVKVKLEGKIVIRKSCERGN